MVTCHSVCLLQKFLLFTSWDLPEGCWGAEFAGKTRAFACKTHGKYELIGILCGSAKVLKHPGTAMSEGGPPTVALVSVCEALPDTFPFILQHRLSMKRASEPLPAALCTAGAPIARLDSPSFKPLPPRRLAGP